MVYMGCITPLEVCLMLWYPLVGRYKHRHPRWNATRYPHYEWVVLSTVHLHYRWCVWYTAPIPKYTTCTRSRCMVEVSTLRVLSMLLSNATFDIAGGTLHPGGMDTLHVLRWREVSMLCILSMLLSNAALRHSEEVSTRVLSTYHRSSSSRRYEYGALLPWYTLRVH